MRKQCFVLCASLVVIAGCGGTGDFAADAGVASNDSVTLALSSRQVMPAGTMGVDGSPDRIVFRRVSADTATIGRVQSDNLVESDERPTSQALLDEYLISSTEITQAQWEAMTGETPWNDLLSSTGVVSSLLVGPQLPAVGMTRDQVEEVCRRFAPPGWRLSLPSPEQWEHAALAGGTTRYAWGDLASDTLVERHANVWMPSPTDPASRLRPHVVGSHLANGFGLHDMHGNAWEMTTAGGTAKVVVCGGAWDQPVLQARASNRMQVPADVGLPTVGVRLVLVRE